MKNVTLRRSFLMSLEPDKQDLYEEKANALWPDLSAEMKKYGIHQYTIFLDPDSSLLVGYLEYETEEGLAELTATPICQSWWEQMSALMPSNPDHSPISSDLKEVFHLD